MICPNCGSEINKNQKFCTQCGTKLQKKQYLKWLTKNKLPIIYTSIIVILFVFAACYAYYINSEKLLYQIVDNDNNSIYINEWGKEVLTIPKKKYDYSGRFIEGRVFAAKSLHADIQIEGEQAYDIGYVAIIDKNGKTVKAIKKPLFYVTGDGETSVPFVYEFYKGYALIHVVNNLPKTITNIEQLKLKDVYINRNGEEVDSKDVPQDVKKMLSNAGMARFRFKTDNDIIQKVMKCENDTANDCFAYIDRKTKKVILKPIYDEGIIHCGDWYSRNSNFYHGIAMVSIHSNDTSSMDEYRYIDKKGRFINHETYDYAEPFYGKLAAVAKGYKVGFINRRGKWVWSIERPANEEYSGSYEENEEETSTIQDNLTPAQVLSQIDNLQTEYFSIIKRNDVLFQMGDDETVSRDKDDLNNLFSEVENKIDKDNPLMQKYNRIEKQFAENSGTTTTEMIDFSKKQYDAVDKLLNETYQEVKRKIPQADFNNLVTDELKWLKDVDSYLKIYDQQDFGSYGPCLYLDAQINMRNFRTLLLMLYLN